MFKNFNVRQKGSFYNSRKFRSFGAKCVRMVGKIKLCKGQVLTFKPQIEVKLP
jgi:hypothetical protein